MMRNQSVTPFKNSDTLQLFAPDSEWYSVILDAIDGRPSSCQIFHRGECLYHAGDSFDCLYVMVSGSAKSFSISDAGEQQITDFVMPGDVVGLDGFDTNQYACSVDFLETSNVRSIPIKQLHCALAKNGELSQALFRYMSQYLKDRNYMMFSLCNLDSEQRLASFLLEQSKSFKSRGFSDRIFNLSMTRVDIANHLGMTIETVSRLMKKLQQKGMIRANRGHIIITDIEKLRECLEEAGGEKAHFYSHHETTKTKHMRESA